VRVKFWENPPRHVFSPNLHARRAKLQGRFQVRPSAALALLVRALGSSELQACMQRIWRLAPWASCWRAPLHPLLTRCGFGE
jgi:hypothetical protein